MCLFLWIHQSEQLWWPVPHLTCQRDFPCRRRLHNPCPRATAVHPIPVNAPWHRISVLLHLRLRPCSFSGHLATHVTRLFVLEERVPIYLCECVVCVVFHRRFFAKAWKHNELLHVFFLCCWVIIRHKHVIVLITVQVKTEKLCHFHHGANDLFWN